MPRIVLASSSPYRRELLSRLRIPFTCRSPDIDESPQPGEPPQALAIRLAQAKALALASQYPDHLIIGSDQVAALDEQIIGKPLTLENAQRQLSAASGKRVEFLTGLALLNSRTGRLQSDSVSFAVHFRPLGDAQILRYLQAEEPFDCAGSFKAEGLGVALFSKTEGEDATSLIGLPLIRLVDMLLAEDLTIP